MTAWEWVLWRAFMLLEPNLFNPTHYYFAALTAEVARGHSKNNARGTNLEDRLIEFVLKKKEGEDFDSYEYDEDKTMRDYDNQTDGWPCTPDGVPLPKKIVAKMKHSKRSWFTGAGLDRKGNVTDVAKRKATQPLPPGIKRGPVDC